MVPPTGSDVASLNSRPTLSFTSESEEVGGAENGGLYSIGDVSLDSQPAFNSLSLEDEMVRNLDIRNGSLKTLGDISFDPLPFCSLSLEDERVGDVEMGASDSGKQEEHPSTHSNSVLVTAEEVVGVATPSAAERHLCCHTRPTDHFQCVPLGTKYLTSLIKHTNQNHQGYLYDNIGGKIHQVRSIDEKYGNFCYKCHNVPKNSLQGTAEQKMSGEAVEMKHVIPQQGDKETFPSNGFRSSIASYKGLDAGSIIYTCEVRKIMIIAVVYYVIAIVLGFFAL